MTVSAPPKILMFARDRRGAAGIELALWTGVLLTIAALCFDLYSLVRVDAGVGRNAVTMAEYVSRETEPDGDQMAALGRFLHRQEFGAPVDAVYVISAVRVRSGESPAEVIWTDDTIRLGDPATAEVLAEACARRAERGWRPWVLGESDDAGVAAGRVAIVVEVCARPSREGLLASHLAARDIYDLHITPARDPDREPAPPARSVADGRHGARDVARKPRPDLRDDGVVTVGA